MDRHHPGRGSNGVALLPADQVFLAREQVGGPFLKRADIAFGWGTGHGRDIEIEAREIVRIRSRLNVLYAKYTGQPIEEIEKAMDRDKFIEAGEAKEFGIIDEVFETRPEQRSTAAMSTWRGPAGMGLSFRRAGCVWDRAFARFINRISRRLGLFGLAAPSISVPEMAQRAGTLTQGQACALYKSG